MRVIRAQARLLGSDARHSANILLQAIIPALYPVIPAKAGIRKAANAVGIRRERDMSARPSPSAHEGA